MAESEEEKKYTAKVIVSSLGNERRTILFNEMAKEEIQKLIQTVTASFDYVRTNTALFLTGSDGQMIWVNLENVALIEVQVVD
jgi:site-specific recombinase XerD